MKQNMTDETLKIQIHEALSGLNSIRNLIAYEPVWAIGTGLQLLRINKVLI